MRIATTTLLILVASGAAAHFTKLKAMDAPARSCKLCKCTSFPWSSDCSQCCAAYVVLNASDDQLTKVLKLNPDTVHELRAIRSSAIENDDPYAAVIESFKKREREKVVTDREFPSLSAIAERLENLSTDQYASLMRGPRAEAKAEVKKQKQRPDHD
jgi:hypothetical protein